MKLRALIRGLNLQIRGSQEVHLTGISSDSRTVAPGNLFIAKKGASFDGAQFIPQAVSAGAVCVVTDIFDPFLNLPQIIHPFPNEIEAKLAARYYDRPSEELFVVGVTGTKGKTTTTYLIKHLLDGLGMMSGLMGTVETIIGDARFSSSLTTHDVISNQKWLKEMVQKGCKGAVLEVSSHGLIQGRVDGIDFDLGLFTNLYPDHLDYHRTIEEYAAAKRILFKKAKQGIFNADSPWSESMGKGFTFGLEKGKLRAEEILLSPKGAEFKVEGQRFNLPLIGRFNVYNALGAIAVGLHLGASLEKMSDLLAQFGSVPARLERIGNVFIDFAHNEEALENALKALKEIAKGRLIVVFGCGGNRDPGRRAGMARAAEGFADISIITNDNPRKEDPEKIAKEIVSGFQKAPIVELDRKKAIAKAIEMARKEDLVLIAGKGHERVQIFAHQTLPFDDAAIVKEILQS